MSKQDLRELPFDMAAHIEATVFQGHSKAACLAAMAALIVAQGQNAEGIDRLMGDLQRLVTVIQTEYRRSLN